MHTPLVIIWRGVTACGGVSHMHFIQNIHTRGCAVFPLFIGLWGYFIQDFRGNTAPGNPRPPTAVNDRTCVAGSYATAPRTVTSTDAVFETGKAPGNSLIYQW